MALAREKDPQGVAEAHGLVTGIVAGQPNLAASELYLHWMSLELDQDSNKEQDRHAILTQALRSTQQTLGSEDMDFEPLLPALNQPLTQRTEALAEWCAGFLAGFGVSGGRVSDEQANEALAMLGEIARAANETGEDGDALAQETEEQAMAELIEFVKVAVLLLHEERRLNLMPGSTREPSAH